MDVTNLQAYQQNLLNQVYLQKIEQNDNQLKLWMQYKDKHKKIIQAIEQLMTQLSVNCIVPIGKKALMKGKLMHINEILVCIGDGYFVKYSAQQAIALCDRRIKNSEEIIENLEKERNFLEVRQLLQLNSGAFEFGDCKDVIEYWDEGKLKEWKIEHRTKEKEYRQKMIKIKDKCKETFEKQISEVELFKKLDELELEEELADELNRLGKSGAVHSNLHKDKEKNFKVNDSLDDKKHEDKDECNDINSNKSSRKFQVSIIKEHDASEVITDKYSGIKDHSNERVNSEKLKNSERRVSFANPHFVEAKSTANDTDILQNAQVDENSIIKIEFRHSQIRAFNLENTNGDKIITSPSDIYTMFSKPKSILKVSSRVNYVYKNLPLIEDTLEEDCMGENNNFEKSTYTSVVQDIQEKNIDTTITKSFGKLDKNRPVSRFKLERAQQKK